MAFLPHFHGEGVGEWTWGARGQALKGRRRGLLQARRLWEDPLEGKRAPHPTEAVLYGA